MQLVFSMLVLQVRPRVTFSDHAERSWDAFTTEVSAAATAYLRTRLAQPD
jgi:hypothetical protein